MENSGKTYKIDRDKSHEFDYLTGYPSKDYPFHKKKIYNLEKDYSSYNIDKSMFEFYVDCVSDRLDETFIEYLDEKFTNRDMIKLVYKVAKSLKQSGIKKGSHVVSIMPNTPEVRALIYACSLVGATIHPIDPRTNPEALKEMTKDADLILCFEDLYKGYEEALASKKVITAGAIECFSKVRLLKEAYKLYRNHEKLPEKVVIEKTRMVTDWKSFIALGKKYRGKITSAYESNKVAIIESTSGTTGIPKGVMLSDKNVNYVALEHIKVELDYQKGDTILDLLLPSIAYWLGTFHAMQCLGLKTYVMPALVLENFPNVLKDLKPNNLILGPIHLEQLVKKDNLIVYLTQILTSNNIKEDLQKIIKNRDLVDLKEKLIIILNSDKDDIKEKLTKLIKKEDLGDLSFIKHIISGGDVLSHELLEETTRVLRKHNCYVDITNGYGLTEGCGVIGINPDRNRGKKEVVWFPFPDNDVTVFKEKSFEECKTNEPGEICIKINPDSSVMLGYENDEEKTNQKIIMHDDGSKWLHTEDIGYIDDEGFVHNNGRYSEIIFKAGFKISPNTVENVILMHPMVQSCKVIGIDDSKFRSIPAAFIVLKDTSIDRERLISEIKELCAKNLTYDYFTPDVFEVIDKMPLNNSGKPDKKALRKILTRN